MWWQLLNRLFGWDYVHLENTATEEIRRVRRTANGTRYVKYYGDNLVWIDDPKCHWRITPLTNIEPPQQRPQAH